MTVRVQGAGPSKVRPLAFPPGQDPTPLSTHDSLRKAIMKVILFVCTGNICRSPMAAGLLRQRLADRGLAGKYQVLSAGVNALDGYRASRNGIFVGDKFLRPSDVDDKFVLNDEKTMINVGSVGQPRDGNPQASYVILEGRQVTFRRVPYPVDKTVEKIYAIPELDDFLGDRLKEGR